MKKAILIMFLLFTGFYNCFSQKITPTEKQFSFFKTWNFVKYYHPALATGSVDADSIFFKMLPLLDEAKSKEQFNKLIRSFLQELPLIATNKKAGKPTGQTLQKNTSQPWLSANKLLDKENINTLAFIYQNRHTDSIHHYIPNLRFYPEIPNEREYKYPDTATIPTHLRMLALARLQGAVDYLFPHKYLMDENFDKTVKKFLPHFAEHTTRAQYEKNLLAIVSTFDDTHAFKIFRQIKNRRTIFNNPYYPPFSYAVFDKEIVVKDIIVPELCDKAGITKGTIITAINNKPVAQLVKELSALIAVSNKPTLRHYLSDYRNNFPWATSSSQVSLSIKKGRTNTTESVHFIDPSNKERIQPVNAYIISKQPVKRTDASLDTLPGNIAYIKINDVFRFIENTADQFVDETMDSLLTIAAAKKGIVFDMRGYPDWGGFVHTFIVKKFGVQPNRYADYYEINKAAIGKFILNDNAETYNNTDIKQDGKPYLGKVVIIVNPETLSMSEWNTMNLQHVFPQSITIGEQSAGADGDEKSMNIPGGYKVNFTGNAIFYPDGTAAQRKGVKINRVIPLTKKAVLSDEDELLKAAIKIINN